MPVYGSGQHDDVSEVSYISTVLNISESAATEIKVGSSRLVGRQQVLIHNYSGSLIYLGPSTVTRSGTTRGIPVGLGEFMHWNFGDIGLYAIAESGISQVIVQEVA